MMNLVANPHRSQEIGWSQRSGNLERGTHWSHRGVEDRSRVSRSRLVLSGVGMSVCESGWHRGVNLETSELKGNGWPGV